MSAMSSPIGIDDEPAIVAQARLGDAKAFSELLRRYEGKIFRLALHIAESRRRRRCATGSVSEGLRAPRPIPGAIEVLYLGRAHRGKSGAHEAAQAQVRPVGFAR